MQLSREWLSSAFHPGVSISPPFERLDIENEPDVQHILSVSVPSRG